MLLFRCRPAEKWKSASPYIDQQLLLQSRCCRISGLQFDAIGMSVHGFTVAMLDHPSSSIGGWICRRTESEAVVLWYFTGCIIPLWKFMLLHFGRGVEEIQMISCFIPWMNWPQQHTVFWQLVSFTHDLHSFHFKHSHYRQNWCH